MFCRPSLFVTKLLFSNLQGVPDSIHSTSTDRSSTMRLSSTQPLGGLLLAAAFFSKFAIAAAADATSTTAAEPCTATSASGFHDLRRDTAVQLPEGVKKNKNGAPNTDYFARGWDYPSNFTINICAPVVEPVKKVVGIDEDNWRNVSAYYKSSDGKVYSLGSVWIIPPQVASNSRRPSTGGLYGTGY